MTNREPRDVGASIRQRLLNLARERGDDFQLVLTRYALERLLYRLGRTEHRDRFVLKGATLFAAWFETPYRATRDLDLLGRGESSAESILVLFQELCAIATPEDGLDFQADTVQAGEIMDAQEYEGLRVTMTALLAGARIPIQVDIGFGDAVTPGTEELELPTLLDHPRPRVLAYPPESVIAEKLQAMVTLGVANSRMKDFYDVAALAQKRGFKGRVLCEAIRATFGRRGTALPEKTPTALTHEFAGDPVKRAQWDAFVKRAGLREAGSFADAVGAIRSFLAPPLDALAAGRLIDASWSPGGPWT
jgi:predicted nucleotidyltransferase component of viral defense system